MGSSKKKQKERSPIPGGMAAAVRWPFHEIMVSRNWRNPSELVTILVSRSAPTGKIAASSFLVDLACLGVKSAIVRTYTASDYAQLRQGHMNGQPLMPAELDLVAKIIQTGLDYASDLGFKPDQVCPQALYLLTGAQPENCSIPVATGGPEGKPLFVAGPYDDGPRIASQLTQRLGAGNFDYVLPIDEMFWSEDETDGDDARFV